MNEKISGRDLETGILQRVRSWTDLFPVLVLLRALRVCGSPIYMSVSLAIWLFWAAILGGQVETSFKGVDVLRPLSELRFLADAARGLWTTWSGYSFAIVAIAIFVALIPVTILIRAGGLYAAGREPGGMADATRFISKRFGSLLIQRCCRLSVSRDWPCLYCYLHFPIAFQESVIISQSCSPSLSLRF
jgi:hypothetical protein